MIDFAIAHIPDLIAYLKARRDSRIAQVVPAALTSPVQNITNIVNPFVPPQTGTLPIGGPLTASQPYGVAYPPSSGCRCPQTKERRKPRKPRAVCYRGSYIETSKGLTKKRLEEIPCQ